MTDELAADQPAPVPRRRRAARVVAPARPVYEKAFRDPVRDSHLELKGLSFVERHLARAGLVTLLLLLVSLLFSNVWRRGDLLAIGEDATLAFLPSGLLPVTLTALVIAWTLLMWGALRASATVRVVVAISFLSASAFLSASGAFDIGDHRSLRWGPHLIEVGYWLPVGALIASSLVVRLRRTSRWLLPVFRLAVVAGLAMFFLTHLWMEQAFVEEGFPGNVQILVDGAIEQILGLQNPLIYVSAVLLIDFSLDVTEGVGVAARDVSRWLARWLLVALIAVKLGLEVGRQWSTWVDYLANRPGAVVHTLVMTLVLAITVRLVARFRMTTSFEGAKEALLYGGGVALSLVFVSATFLTGGAAFAYTQFDSVRVYHWLDGYPVDWLLKYGQPIWAGLVLVGGLMLLRRGTRNGETRRPFEREVGSGMIVIGVWLLPEFILDATQLNPGFSFELVDIMVTVAIAVFLAVRWRRTDASDAITLAAITVFSWLVMSRGDWIAFLGGRFGLPAILVVAFGIAFSLAGDSGFTRGSSKRLPQGSRVLMFVGYLVLSVAILHWIATSHSIDYSGTLQYGGFRYLGIPWAAWILGRRLLDLDDRIDAIEAEEDAIEAASLEEPV